MKLKKWKVLESRIINKDKFLEIRNELVELPGGVKIKNYKQLKGPDVVIVFAVTEEGNALMIKEYKHGARKIMLTMPAGLLLDNETPKYLAQKELEEETGYRANSFMKLATLREYPTKMQHKIHVFLAPKAYKVGKQRLEASENIKVELIPLEKLKQLVINGEVESSSIVATIFLGLQKLMSTKSWKFML